LIVILEKEIKDLATEVATKTVPAGGLTFFSAPWWSSVNWTAVLSGVLVVLQIAYLLRKWWREETTVGTWLRKKSGAPISKSLEEEA
jgi:hypothetical protein